MGRGHVILGALAAATLLSAVVARAPLGGKRPASAAPPEPVRVAPSEPWPDIDCVDGPGRTVRCTRPR